MLIICSLAVNYQKKKKNDVAKRPSRMEFATVTCRNVIVVRAVPGPVLTEGAVEFHESFVES